MNLGLTEAQLLERRKGIGGSDAGRIMAGDWISLFNEKTGRSQPDDLSGNLAVQMGNATEDFNAYWFSKVTGRDVGERRARVQCDRRPWMIANLDGVTTTAGGKPAYWDAKHVGRSDEAMILRYTPQMVHCATILRLDWWVLSVFIGNSKHEIIEQEVDPFYAEELTAREREFWGYVERDEEPPDMAPTVVPKPAPKLRTIVIATTPDHAALVDGRSEALNWAGDLAELVPDFARTEAAAKKYAIVREQLKTLIPEDCGDLTYGLFRAKRSKAGALTMKMEKGEG